MFCRLCLHKSEVENFTSVFVTTGVLKWEELIIKHLNLKIKQNDAHSKVICPTCTNKLKEFNEFYELVKNRQLLLLEIEANIQASSEQTTSKTQLDESVQLMEDFFPINVKSEVSETEYPSQMSGCYDNKDEMDSLDIYISKNKEYTTRIYESVDKDINQRTCAVCKKVLITVEALKIHINDIHMKPLAQSQTKSQSNFKNAPYTTNANKCSDRAELEDRTCILCDKTFKRMSTLLAHMKRFHTGVHPFECNTCGVKFLTHRGLNSHFQISKNCEKDTQTLNPNQQELNFANQLNDRNAAYRTCSICQVLYENWKYLEKHMLAKHDGVRPYHCKPCGKTFRLKLQFHSHLKSTPTCVNVN